jgi:hypothetical protein
MSLNSGQGPKAEMRMQLQKLIDEYQADGGSISRGRGSKTTIVCTICNSRRHASLDYALSFGRRCHRCGGETRMTRLNMEGRAVTLAWRVSGVSATGAPTPAQMQGDSPASFLWARHVCLMRK